MDPAHDRENILTSLHAATAHLEGSMNKDLIPPEGFSFGFALHGARDRDGVAVVTIRRDEEGERHITAGTCVFGSDDPVVPILLTMMKFDQSIRSAAILQFSRRAMVVLEDDLFLECCSVNAVSAGSGISTMDWSMASCCKKSVPDVIIRKRNSDAASRIILSGEGPADVANNIIICSNRI